MEDFASDLVPPVIAMRRQVDETIRIIADTR